MSCRVDFPPAVKFATTSAGMGMGPSLRLYDVFEARTSFIVNSWISKGVADLSVNETFRLTPLLNPYRYPGYTT